MEDELIEGGQNKHLARNQPPPDHLPFNQKMQAAVLGWLCVDQAFFMECITKVKEGWFTQHYHQRLWRAMATFYARMGRAPKGSAEILADIDIKAEDPKEKTAIKAAIVQAEAARPDFGLDNIRKQLNEWMEAVTLYSTIKNTVEMFSQQRFQDAVTAWKKGVQDLSDAKFSDNLVYDWDKWQSQMQEEDKELEGALTFGLDAIDQNLTPQAKSGSLLIGDMTLIVAPLGSGKTRSLVTVASANLKRQKDVLVITHEGRPAEIRNMFLCNILSKPSQNLLFTNKDLIDSYRNPEFARLVQEVVDKMMKPHLTYVPIHRAGVMVEEVVGTVRSLFQQRKARTGKGYDMIMVDYPGKEGTEQGKGGKLERRHRDEIVYNMWSDLAGELKCHVLAAQQTNRQGFKTVRGRGDNRLLNVDDSAESIGPGQAAANILTANLDPVTKNMTWLICKSRNNRFGIAIACKSALGSAIVHHNNLGATWYDGDEPLGDRAEKLLEQFRGKEIPRGELHGF